MIPGMHCCKFHSDDCCLICCMYAYTPSAQHTAMWYCWSPCGRYLFLVFRICSLQVHRPAEHNPHCTPAITYTIEHLIPADNGRKTLLLLRSIMAGSQDTQDSTSCMFDVVSHGCSLVDASSDLLLHRIESDWAYNKAQLKCQLEIPAVTCVVT